MVLRSFHFSRRFVALILLLAALSALTSCSGGSVNLPSSSSRQPTTTSGSATIFGRARNHSEAVASASVAVMASDGSVIPLAAPCVTDDGGHFAAQLVRLPLGSLIVQVTNPQGEVFATELATLPDKVVHVNAITTLCQAYHQRHPELSIAQARSQVHLYARIPALHEYGDEIAHARFSKVSLEHMLAVARAYPGGLTAYIQSILPAVEAATVTQAPAPLNSSDADYFVSLSQSFAEILEPKPIITQTVEKTGFGLLEGLGDGLIDGIIGLVINQIPGIGDAPEIAAVEAQLNVITQQLDQIMAGLAQLAVSITTAFTQTQYTTLAAALVNQVGNISSAYSELQLASQYAGPPADSTNFAQHQQNLLASTYANLYQYAQDIHRVQYSGADPSTTPLMTLARTLAKLDQYLATATLTVFANQATYYAGLQAQAARALAARAAPAYVGTGSQSTYNFNSSPAGALNQGQMQISGIADQVALEMSAVPFPLVDAGQVYDIKNNALFQGTSLLSSTGGTSWTYGVQLVNGGVSGWRPATRTQLLALFHTTTPVGGSYSAALNAAGFTLKPGPITYWESDYQGSQTGGNWYRQWTTITARGFLCPWVDASNALHVDWVGDDGSSGSLCTYVGGDRPEQALDSAQDLLVSEESSKYGPIVHWAGHVNGPVVLAAASLASFMQQPQSFTPIALGYYSGLTVQAGLSLSDQSGAVVVQQLSAAVIPTEDEFSTFYSMTTDVFWSSSDPINAPVSNLPVAGGLPPDPPPQFILSPPFMTPQQVPGTVTWLPASAGKSVTFTASRRRPDGTVATGSVTLTSPAPAGRTESFDGVDVWPTVYGIRSSDLMSINTGLQLWPSLHTWRGSFTDARSVVTYTSSDARVQVSNTGLVTSLLPMPTGSVFTITVSYPACTARSSATCRVTVVSP